MRRGFTLIETVTALAIASVLLCFESSILIKYFNNYNSYINRSKSSSFCMEALVIIDNLLYDNMEEIQVKNNTINVSCKDNKKRVIYLNSNSGKVLVDYYDGNGSDFSAANVVCTRVSNMEVVKKDNVIYLTITNKEGEKFSRCLGVKKVY